MPALGRMKNIIKTWTRKGVPRIRSTQAPMMDRRILFLLDLMIPHIEPMMVPAIRLNPETATVIQSPLRKNGRLRISSLK
jgi:hypothetical protein